MILRFNTPYLLMFISRSKISKPNKIDNYELIQLLLR